MGYQDRLLRATTPAARGCRRAACTTPISSACGVCWRPTRSGAAPRPTERLRHVLASAAAHVPYYRRSVRLRRRTGQRGAGRTAAALSLSRQGAGDGLPARFRRRTRRPAPAPLRHQRRLVGAGHRAVAQQAPGRHREGLFRPRMGPVRLQRRQVAHAAHRRRRAPARRSGSAARGRQPPDALALPSDGALPCRHRRRHRPFPAALRACVSEFGCGAGRNDRSAVLACSCAPSCWRPSRRRASSSPSSARASAARYRSATA